jgi:hypothetical protein
MIDGLKTQDSKQQEDAKKTTTTENCIKIWSEASKRWRYVPKDPEYFKIKYYKYLGPKTCSNCGTVVQTQMCRHQRSQKCRLLKQENDLKTTMTDT